MKTSKKKEVRANVERVINALKAELGSITSLAKDYAGWDDSYRFVQDGNSAFIRKNLGDPNFEQLGMNLIVYVNTRGQWVYFRAFDQQKKQESPFPQSLREIITPSSPLLKENARSKAWTGILTLPEGILLISGVPILTSDIRGPSTGTLVMGRFLIVPKSRGFRSSPSFNCESILPQAGIFRCPFFPLTRKNPWLSVGAIINISQDFPSFPMSMVTRHWLSRSIRHGQPITRGLEP